MENKDYVIIGVLTLVIILTATFTSVKSSKETTKVHDAVMVIDTLKLPQMSKDFDKKIDSLGNGVMARINANDFKIEVVARVADRADKNSGWANNRAAKLEKQIKDLTEKLDSLKTPAQEAQEAQAPAQAQQGDDWGGGDDDWGDGDDGW